MRIRSQRFPSGCGIFKEHVLRVLLDNKRWPFEAKEVSAECENFYTSFVSTSADGPLKIESFAWITCKTINEVHSSRLLDPRGLLSHSRDAIQHWNVGVEFDSRTLKSRLTMQCQNHNPFLVSSYLLIETQWDPYDIVLPGEGFFNRTFFIIFSYGHKGGVKVHNCYYYKWVRLQSQTLNPMWHLLRSSTYFSLDKSKVYLKVALLL